MYFLWIDYFILVLWVYLRNCHSGSVQQWDPPTVKALNPHGRACQAAEGIFVIFYLTVICFVCLFVKVACDGARGRGEEK